MLSDMQEQPAFLRSAVVRFGLLGPLRDSLRLNHRIILTGSGSAYYAALAGAALYSARGVPAQAIPASEFGKFTTSDLENVAVIALSQSGGSSDVLNAARTARRRGAELIAVTNTRRSPLDSLAGVSLFLDAGIERAVPATKSVIAMLAAIAVLAGGSGARALQLAASEVQNALRVSKARLRARVRSLDDAERIFVLGSGLGKACALEGALKLKEAAELPAEAYVLGEFKHGATVMIGPKAVAIALEVDGDARETAKAMLSLRRLGARVIRIGMYGPESTRGSAEARRFAAACKAIVELQGLALHAGLARGLNPDAPRTLKKRVLGWT